MLAFSSISHAGYMLFAIIGATFMVTMFYKLQDKALKQVGK